MPIKVLFVCLGNICRSPTAHAIFEQKIHVEGLSNQVIVDSAGTGSWHIGSPPDWRTRETAAKHGYAMDHLRARQVSANDFDSFDYIFAMDKSNLSDLQDLCPDNYQGTLALFLPFCGVSLMEEVPDPYYGGDGGFERVLSVIERSADKLIDMIKQKHPLPAQSINLP